jgi:hypothetical protein
VARAEERSQIAPPPVADDREQPVTVGDDNLKAAYDEVCRSYERIDDFRAKLLGLLPLAAGAALFSLLGKAPDGTNSGSQAHFYPLVGMFGS